MSTWRSLAEVLSDVERAEADLQARLVPNRTTYYGCDLCGHLSEDKHSAYTHRWRHDKRREKAIVGAAGRALREGMLK